jgi:hypothetical protein
MRPHEHRLRIEAMARAQRERQDAARPATVARRALRKEVKAIADRMARDAHEQVAKAIGVDVSEFTVDLSEQTYGLVDGVVRISEEYFESVTARVSATVDEWQALDPALSPRAGDLDALDTMISDALDAEAGKMFNSTRLLFGDTFAQMNKSVQLSAGVDQYYWVTMNDFRVRVEHNAVARDGPYSWDEEGPLSAEDSDSGEACHPGEDFGCRCTAAPVVPDQDADTDEG